MNNERTLSSYGWCGRRGVAGMVVLAGCAALVLTLANCGGGSPAAPPAPPTPNPSITLSPSSVSLAHSLAGPSTAQFSAEARGIADATIDWSLADATNGSPYDVGTISNTGLYTAPERGSARTVTVTAALHSNPNYRATATIQLHCTATVAITTPEGASVTASQRLRLGVQTQSSCASNAEVSWQVNGGIGNPTNGYIVTESSASVWFYAPSAVPASAVTITAVSKTDAQRAASVAVTVTPDPDALVISPAEATVSLGALQPFVVTRGGRPTAVSWRVNSSAEEDARVGWMRGATYVAPFTVPNPAQVAVMATDTSTTPNRFATALVTVTAPTPNVNDRLQGTFAALLTGAHAFWLGTVVFDGKGAISGSGQSGNVLELETFVSETQSIFTGKVYSGTLSGTYEAGWDGRVVLRANLPGSLYETWDLTFFGPNHADGGGRLQVLERQDLSGVTSSAYAGTYSVDYGLFGYYYGGPGGDCFYCPTWYPPQTTLSTRSGIVRADTAGQLTGEFEPRDYASDPKLVPITGTYTTNSSGSGTATLNLGDQPSPDTVATVAVSANKFLFAGLSQTGKFAVGVAARQPQNFVLSGPYIFQTEYQLVKFEADGNGHIRGTWEQSVWNAYAFAEVQAWQEAPFQAAYTADAYGRITVAVTEAEFGKPSFVIYPVASDRFLVLPGPQNGMDMTTAWMGTGEGYAQAPTNPSDITGRYGIRGRFGSVGGGWVLLDSGYPFVGLSGDQPIRFQFAWPAPSTAKASIQHLSPLDPYNGSPVQSNYYAASADILLLRGGVLEKIKW